MLRYGTFCSFIRTQHPRFENPDGVRRHRNHGTGYARSDEVVQRRERILAVGRNIVASKCTGGRGRSAVEEKKLLLDDRFKAEENGPAACIANQIWSQPTIQALNWMLLGDQVLGKIRNPLMGILDVFRWTCKGLAMCP